MGSSPISSANMDQKVCSKCLLPKDKEDFYVSKRYNNKQCRMCIRELDRLRYNNGGLSKVSANERSSNFKSRNAQYVWDYLKQNPCIECKESDPVVLEFNHRNQEDKLFNITTGISRWNLKMLRAEMDKCDVLCANCHRKHTAIQLGWYKNIIK